MKVLASLSLGLFLIPLMAYSDLLEIEKLRNKIYQQNAPSVVNVTNLRSFSHPFFGTAESQPAGSGSGWIWDDKGHIVTNYHVVAEGEDFQITFFDDKKTYKAKVVGVAPAKDIAVLKIVGKNKGLRPMNMGSSKSLVVGQSTIAIGNPLGLDHTLSAGVVSALGRKIKGIGGVTIHDMIQTDAAINQGNSGGPLFNLSGEVIGMNTMIYSLTGGSNGLGFAVPSDTIKKIVPQLIEYGKVVRPGLGIAVLDDRVKERFFGEKGIAISSVASGGPADKAGLQGLSQGRRGRIFKGDLILKVDGKETNSYDDIYHILDKHKAGDTVEVEYLRDSKKLKAQIRLKTL